MSVAEILGTHPRPLSADECRKCEARCDELLAALRPELTQRSS
jgi:hypothetical protein